MTVMRLQPPERGPPAPPPDRGALLTPEEVSELVREAPEWCRRNVPRKVRKGHRSVGWFKLDVLAWLESRREER